MMGMLFGALEQPLNVEEMTLRQQLTYGIKSMGSRSWHMAKTFAVMGAIFSISECVVEKVTTRSSIAGLFRVFLGTSLTVVLLLLSLSVGDAIP